MNQAQFEIGFREACKWLSKTAPEGANKTQWLIERDMLTSDGQNLTNAAYRALKRSPKWARHLFDALGGTDDQLNAQLAERLGKMQLGQEVAEGKVIPLVGDYYVRASDFDPEKDQRASDVRFLEMNRADIEAAIAIFDGPKRHFLRMILAVAELSGWDERGSPGVWLWMHEYIEETSADYWEWTDKVTRNKKLRGKLERLSSLFSSSGRPPAA